MFTSDTIRKFKVQHGIRLCCLLISLLLTARFLLIPMPAIAQDRCEHLNEDSEWTEGLKKLIATMQNNEMKTAKGQAKALSEICSESPALNYLQGKIEESLGNSSRAHYYYQKSSENTYRFAVEPNTAKMIWYARYENEHPDRTDVTLAATKVEIEKLETQNQSLRSQIKELESQIKELESQTIELGKQSQHGWKYTASNPSQENTQSSSTLNDDSYPLFQFSVMLGSAFGIVGDKTENCDGNAKCMPIGGSPSSISSGPASLPLHLRANAIFNLPKYFQAGIYLRGQLINIVKETLTPTAKDRIKNPDQYNIMVGLALRYLILWEQPYRLYFGLEFGWGGANAMVDMGPAYNNFKDIYLYKGPFHIAPEIGFLWNFHKNVGLAIELTLPIVFPEKPSAFFDLSIGPYFQF